MVKAPPASTSAPKPAPETPISSRAAPPAGLPEDAIHERYASGIAARQKLAREMLPDQLSSTFYFYAAERLGDPRDGPSDMRFTGCEHRQARSGPRKGRWVISIPSRRRSVVVTPSEIAAAKEALQLLCSVDRSD